MEERAISAARSSNREAEWLVITEAVSMNATGTKVTGLTVRRCPFGHKTKTRPPTTASIPANAKFAPKTSLIEMPEEMVSMSELAATKSNWETASAKALPRISFHPGEATLPAGDPFSGSPVEKTKGPKQLGHECHSLSFL